MADAAPAERSEAPARKGVLALFDQAIVSGTSFLATILVGRFGGDDELGLYALGFSVLALVICVQDTLVLAPYTVFAGRLDPKTRAAYAGHVLLHHALLALATAVGLLVVAGDLTLLGRVSLVGVLMVLAFSTPFVLVREFLRRIGFAHLDLRSVVRLDAGVALLQVLLLSGLAAAGVLTAVTALAAGGLACLLVAGSMLWRSRLAFDIRREGMWEELGRSWRFGRWVVVAQVIGVVHGYAPYWLLGLTLGTAPTGVFAACMTIVLLSNPLVLGLSNILGPSMAHAFAEGDSNALGALVRRSQLLMAGAMGAFAMTVAMFGGTALAAIYGGEYVGHGTTISLLAFAILAGSLSVVPDHGLRVLERPDLNFACGLAGFLVTVVFASTFLIVCDAGLPGAATGYLCGSATSTILRHVALALVARKFEGSVVA